MKSPAVSMFSGRDKLYRLACQFALCSLLTAIPHHARAATGTLSGNTADAQVSRLAGVNSVSAATSAHCRIGNNSADDQQMSVVHVFEIPSAILADPTQWFDTATYTARISGKVVTTRNGDLYGLGYRGASTVLPSDFYAGASDGAATLLKDNFLLPGMTSPSSVAESGAALKTYLNAQLTAARAAGATTAYVFLRTNIDAIGNYQYYQLGMAEGGGVNIPTIAYSTVTVPAWVQVPLGGGGCVNGLVSSPSGADIYCRTDVGTAFRWVPAPDGLNGQWLSITDTIVPTTTTGASGLACTASLAVDPSNANNLYVAAGSKYAPLRGLYASSDKGATWTVMAGTTTWIIDGNGAFNGTGERLAVDPNNPNIVWYGSTENGLQKGVKSGGSWSWTQQSIPVGANAADEANNKAGVTFVACDPNGGNTIVYAGVFDSAVTGASSTGGIYQSTNGGTSWTKVSGVAVEKPNRGQVAPNGTLYVTAGITKKNSVNGQVAKMARGGSLVDITPPGGNIHYRGLAVDPNDATGATVYVAHLSPTSSYNRIWRSTNGGASGSWVVQDQTNMNRSTSIVPRTEPDGTPAITGYWLGAISSLLITPGNANELWAGDFFGVARTRNAPLLGNAPGNAAVWYMLQKNQDETCVEAVRNAPTGPELMVGTADVGGYKYNDIYQRPYGAYGNVFTSPGGANVNSLDFSEANHSVWARTWTGNDKMNDDDHYGSGGYSRDGGTTWNAFGEITTKIIPSSLTAGWETLDVTPYLKAQKAKGATSVTVVIASFKNTKGVDGYGKPDPKGAVMAFDSREGANKPYLNINTGGASLLPVADSTVSGTVPTTNYGSALTLETCWFHGISTGERHIYMRFDLSSVGAINSAILNLYRNAATSSANAGIAYSITALACSDYTTVGGSTPWSESTITWDSGRRKPYASDTAQLFSAEPHFNTHAGAYLSGGRVAVSSSDPDRLVWLPFAKKNAPLNVPHFSTDAGATWNPCAGLPTVIRLIGKSNPSYLMQQLAADRVNADTFYIMDPGGTNGAKNFYKSTDGGANWSFVSSLAKTTTSANVYRVQIVAAPAAGHVWVTDDGVDFNTTEGGLWKSTNGAASWSAKLPNIVGVRQVAFGKPPTGSSYLYSVYFHGYYNGVKGIYRSDDYGATWNALPALPSVISVESLGGDRQIHGGVFIGTGGRGVFQYQP